MVGQAQKLKKLSKNHVFCVFLQKYGQMAEIEENQVVQREILPQNCVIENSFTPHDRKTTCAEVFVLTSR